MSRQNPIKTNDKEVNAVIFNMKEQRCLVKSLSTLDAEASYSVKLIDLNNRGIKLFYKRFKDKVGKIKSHLNAEEIVRLKELDESGKMKELVKPLNITGALRIADAEKRLKLQGREPQRVSRSAVPRRALLNCVERQRRPSTCKASVSFDGVENRRSKSLVSEKRSSIFPVSSELEKNNLKLSSSTEKNVLKIEQLGSSDKSNSTVDLLGLPETRQRSNSISLNKTQSDTVVENTLQATSQPSRQKSPERDRNIANKNEINNNSESLIENKNNRESTESSHPTTFKEQTVEDFIMKPVSEMKIPKPSISRQTDISRNSFSRDFPLILKVSTNNEVDSARENEEGQKNCNIQEEVHEREQQDRVTEKRKHVTIATEESNKLPSMDELIRRSSSVDRRTLSRMSSYTKSSHSTTSKTGQFSCHNTNSDNTFGYVIDNPYEERRRILLDIEHVHASSLIDKKDDFLDEIDEYLRSQEPQEPVKPVETELTERTEQEIVTENKPIISRRERQRRKMQLMHQRSSAAEKARRDRDTWKDINKCRYLRVEEDKLDLNSMVSLAKDQIKLGNLY